MCVDEHTHVHTCVWKQDQTTPEVFLLCTPHYFLSQGLS